MVLKQVYTFLQGTVHKSENTQTLKNMNKKLDTNSIGHPDERGGELREKTRTKPYFKTYKKLNF